MRRGWIGWLLTITVGILIGTSWAAANPGKYKPIPPVYAFGLGFLTVVSFLWRDE